MKYWNGKVKRTSWGVTYTWVILSMILAATITFSFVQVDWLIRRETVVVVAQSGKKSNTFPIKDAISSPTTLQQIQHPRSSFTKQTFKNTLDNLNGSSNMNNTYTVRRIIAGVGVFGFCKKNNNHCEIHRRNSYIWRILTFLGGLGCLTMSVSSIMSIMSITLPTADLRYYVAKMISYAQIISGILLLLPLIGFPLCIINWDGALSICGPYKGSLDILGACDIGWAYALLIVSTSLSIYCPILAHFTITTSIKSCPQRNHQLIPISFITITDAELII